MDKGQFGQWLSILRKQRGMSQQDLANALSISASAVSKWERGNNYPDLPMTLRIAEIFQISCDMLLIPKLDQKVAESGEFKGRKTREEIESNVAEKKAAGQRVKMRLRFALAGAALLLLCAACGYAVAVHFYRETANTEKIRPIGARYRENPQYGKLYEVAFVMAGDSVYQDEFLNEFMDQHSEELKVIVEPTLEKGTEGMWIRYYDSEEEAASWSEKEAYGICVFFPKEREER